MMFHLVVFGLLLLVRSSSSSSSEEDEECARVEAPMVLLSNGVWMPRVGLGTAGRMGMKTVEVAYDVGVRLFDTARAAEWYDEDAVARALRGRREAFVVTKLHPRDHGEESATRAVEDSARRFGGVVDLFLLHYPSCWDGLCGKGWQSHVEGTWRESWRALERAYERKLVRAIGVSNFRSDELQQLFAFATVGPHAVQNFFDPFHQDRAAKALAENKGVAYVSYSTLGTQWANDGVVDKNPVHRSATLAKIAETRGSDVSSVVLAWALARGAVVIPRSFNPTHVRANANVLKDDGTLAVCLTEGDLRQIDLLDGKAHDDDDDDRKKKQRGAPPGLVGGKTSDHLATTGKRENPSLSAYFSADVPANLYWLDDQGQRHLVATLDPHGPPTRITTFPGHTFLAVSPASNATAFQVNRDAAPGTEAFFHLERSPTKGRTEEGNEL